MPPPPCQSPAAGSYLEGAGSPPSAHPPALAPRTACADGGVRPDVLVHGSPPCALLLPSPIVRGDVKERQGGPTSLARCSTQCPGGGGPPRHGNPTRSRGRGVCASCRGCGVGRRCRATRHSGTPCVDTF
ncbi:hypothetical protein ACP70R_040380 [Stipagrostis hirtigluma subsp. patula]